MNGHLGRPNTLISLRMGQLDVLQAHGMAGTPEVLVCRRAGEYAPDHDCVRIGLQIAPNIVRNTSTIRVAVDLSSVIINHQDALPDMHWGAVIGRLLNVAAPVYEGAPPVPISTVHLNVNVHQSQAYFASKALESACLLQLETLDISTSIAPTAKQSRVGLYMGYLRLYVAMRHGDFDFRQLTDAAIADHFASVLADQFIELSILTRVDALPALRVELRNRKLAIDCQADALSVCRQTIEALISHADLSVPRPDGPVPTNEEVDAVSHKVEFTKRPVREPIMHIPPQSIVESSVFSTPFQSVVEQEPPTPPNEESDQFDINTALVTDGQRGLGSSLLGSTRSASAHDEFDLSGMGDSVNESQIGGTRDTDDKTPTPVPSDNGDDATGDVLEGSLDMHVSESMFHEPRTTERDARRQHGVATPTAPERTISQSPHVQSHVAPSYQPSTPPSRVRTTPRQTSVVHNPDADVSELMAEALNTPASASRSTASSSLQSSMERSVSSSVSSTSSFTSMAERLLGWGNKRMTLPSGPSPSDTSRTSSLRASRESPGQVRVLTTAPTVVQADYFVRHDDNLSNEGSAIRFLIVQWDISSAHILSARFCPHPTR